MSFTFEKLSIPGLVIITPKVFPDGRGFFLESYKYSDFAENGINEYFTQDNHSRSAKGVLRGLHYQLEPYAQGKLVRCLEGEIFDVAVDIRKSSPTFGKWFSVKLSAENNKMLYIPKGFAHGFVVISDEAEVYYKCTAEYRPSSERGIIWNDSNLNIDWPVKEPVLSEKDSRYPKFREAEYNFTYKK
ncbi:MAG: dTDP-4-dehydrorhamnose 3,5-epimerase [Deltaproteobacteria bacterium]|nr:dTDP-4-dehydrorhamnose 3,5-epimerase [Deltaproteobacteria bacterium]MBI2975024.1 dTDP-4-dehydrorhamnose 3,5-epimerase [Deltaproteobacteria bacterium]